MKVLVKEMSLVSFNYNLGIRNLSKEQEFGTVKKLIENEDIVPAHLLKNLQREQNDAHITYSLFGLIDVEDSRKRVEHVLGQVAHWHVFFSALRFAL